MDAQRWARLRALFDEALDRPVEARESWAATAAADDSVLLVELLRLLAEERRASGELSLGALEHVPDWDPTQLVGRELSGYRIEGILGRGGMGVVYRAQQRSPRRTVALKTLSSPLSSAKERNRFRLEIEVLGALQHRAIAHVFDAGAMHVDGRPVPYVAMELVEDARDIVRFAAGAKLDTAGRIRLVREVCEGIHHAHRRGIVHRDLKPANLLVDTSGQVKVIDFGLARVDDPHALGVSTLETLAGSVLGTLEYMSPEHVAGAPQDIDVQSDVFSLGCVLYELIVGRPPRDLAGLSLSQAIQRVEASEVVVPRSVPRPLRAILARCLAHQPEHRYVSTAELGADLGRYERGDSVLALRGHTLAMVAGFSRRNRSLLIALSCIIAALSIGLYRANRATKRAVLAKEETRTEADTSLAIATALSSVLSSVQPFMNGPDARVVDVLLELERSLPLIEDRRARASVAAIVGQGLVNLRELERAGPILETALRELTELEGPDSPKRLLAVAGYVDYLEQTGRYQESLDQSRAALPHARARLGVDNFTTRYLSTNTGVCLVRVGALAEARDLYRQMVADALDDEVRNPQYEVATLERLAQVLMGLGQPEEALVELDRAVEIMTATGGARSLFAVALKATRANGEEKLGRFETALALQLEVLAAYEARTDSLGNALVAAINAASLLVELGRLDEAKELLASRAGKLTQIEPEPSRYSANWWVIEARLACARGELESAKGLAQRAIALGARLVPTGWPEDHFARRSLACAQRGLGEHEAALATLRDGLEIARRMYSPTSEQVLGLTWREVALLHDLGRATEAADVASRCAATLRAENATLEAFQALSQRLAEPARAFDQDLSGRSRP
jgi:serine/threonine protein kinase/tetratricopeptide (TPR) repeat protein